MTSDTPAVGILAYWHAVEMFDPRDIPDPRETERRRQGDRCVERIRTTAGEPLPPMPWEAGHVRHGERPATGKFGSEWRHTVYGGIFSYGPVRAAFARVLGYSEKPDYGGTRKDPDSAMFAFTVDQRGALLDGTAVLSSCAWATGRLHRPGPGTRGWLDGFEKTARDCEETMRRVLARPARDLAKAIGKTAAETLRSLTGAVPGEQGSERGVAEETPRIVRGIDVVALSLRLAAALALPDGIADHLEFRVVSVPAFRRKDGSLTDPEPVFLSSLIAPDIQRVRDAVGAGFGPALAGYLGEPLATDSRVDLAADRGALLDGVRPASLPLARWPADTDSPLTASQQFAVNTILAELAGVPESGGLFSVNGPPGTGKTTLLRDLIAAIVVRRAEALAALREPDDAFTKGTPVWRLKPELTGFEIVVGSSNNAAVENVTAELPALRAIGEEWLGEADYFGDQAAEYLGAPAWGAVAAPLGKAENRMRFRERFWYADGGMLQFLRAREREQGDLMSLDTRARAWEAAVDQFTSALRHAQRLAGERGFPAPAEWADLPRDEQELAAPWSDEEWTVARTRVFLAALSLHAAFIAGAAGRILHNMGHLLAALSRDSSAPKGEDLKAAWQTLFLLVPVISTTFASCGRMFGALGKESLGWLLIDEAGQALPQAAVGALWRARRAVVVGDPLQLRPISQVPGEIQERLRGMSFAAGAGAGAGGGTGIGAEWQPSAASAQVLADRRNRWGTVVHPLDGPEDDVWVGAPLRVHRRCEEPMFGISNTIAYGGLMVYATRAEPFPGGGYPDYPRSSWVDVTGLGDGKWVPAQGDALLAILRRLRDRGGVSLNRVYVLSPFRDVVERCRFLVRREMLPAGNESDSVRDFADTHVGTVHTMQGKESDVVILVLGTDPSPGKKARDWAAQPVNLLNVAVSRARRRLFVVGDRAEWSAAPNFGVLAERLPRVRWRSDAFTGM